VTQSYNTVSGTYDFGSIIRALQAQQAAAGQTIKEYPYNFQGITEAIRDQTAFQNQNPGSDIGPSPSMGDVTIDENGDPVFTYSANPLDGDLWFDTRQGRMFIAFENDWYQTNGGDGLVIVTASATPPAATNLAIGQQWFNSTDGILYIFAGQYQETDGTIVTTPTATTVPVWAQLVDTTFVPTTANIDIVGGTIDPKITTAVTASNFLPFVDPALVEHQDDINLYYIDCLLALDAQIKVNQPYVNVDPPANPEVGQFWFDSTTIEMSIWYSAPGDAWGQWVPVFSPAKIDDNLNTLKTGLVAETVARQLQETTLQANIDLLSSTVTSNNSTLTNSVNGLQSQINAIPSIDLSPYVTAAQEQTDITNLQNQVDAARSDITLMYRGFITQGALTSTQQTLQANIDTKADQTALTAAIATIPSVTGLASETYVNTQIAANTGLAAAGGTLTGTLTIDKNDIANAGLDYSTNHYDGNLAQKYRTNCQMSTAHYATFGTNSNLYEYNWAFDDNEDFCWTHGTNGKVASIDKSGIAASNFLIATFGTNTSSGRSLTSTIDVGARLATYQTALTNLRTNAATATTLDELKTAIANALVNV
jgi:hypothetical protein